MLVRSTPPQIRDALQTRLLDPEIGGSMTSLKEFLSLFNHAAPGESTLKVSTKGLEMVEYTLYRQNHSMNTMAGLNGLRQVAMRYFTRNQIRGVRLVDTVACIHKLIKINGNQWKAGGVCEYMGRANGGDDALRVGRILSFVVVEYTTPAGRLRGETSTAVFVHMARFAQESLYPTGPKSCTHYRVRITKCRKTDTFVHVSSMTTLLYSVPDSRGVMGVPLVTPILNTCPTGYMYLVPVARAFDAVAL
jgi:hypothetical protein